MSHYHGASPTGLVQQEKRHGSIFVLTLGVKIGSQLDDRRCLGFLTGMISECKYAGCVDTNVCWARVQLLKIVQYRIGIERFEKGC